MTLVRRAEPRDEPGLRRLLRNSPLPGWVRVAYSREPDFFHAAAVQGDVSESLVALDGDRVVGTGCRAIFPAWINGAPGEIGYISGLRLAPEARGGSILARGFRLLREMHEQRPAPAYLTTIIESNAAAQAILTSGRAGLPHYIDQGRYLTSAININRLRRPRRATCEIVTGDTIGAPAISDFLNREACRRQFFPILTHLHFDSPRLSGLRSDDFRVALNRRGEIVGIAAGWNLEAFRQFIVDSYAWGIGPARPAINAALRLAGFHSLPQPGGHLRSVFTAFPCVRENDPVILEALLDRLYADFQRRGFHFLMIGLHERDPLRAALRRFLSFTYASRVYLVCWDDGLDFVGSLSRERPPHLELAML